LLAAAPWLQATFEIYPGTHTSDVAVLAFAPVRH
jgi:hypothetical protein